jgi:CheY-like chemotaxis protein
LKFLVVDDEELVRSLLCDLLADMGHEAVGASGGEEGLGLFDRDHFDAVFTDVGMPRMSGWEFARAVKARRPTLPVAVITGWGEIIGTTERAQADWVLTKPFSMAQIAGVVESVSALLATDPHEEG